MSSVKFELNHKGVGELLKSAEMQSALKKKASEIATRNGEGYVDVFVAGTRATSRVYTNKKDNGLLRSMK